MKRLNASIHAMAVLIAALTLSGCRSLGGDVLGERETSGSDVTSINVGLPDRSSLKARVPDIETKMNAYHLMVRPVDAACVGGTVVDHVGEYKSANADVLDVRLRQGCDYNVTLALGGKGTGSVLDVTYFRNATPVRISKESTLGVPSIALDLNVQVTAEGQALGL